jgi:hypothetical protein
MIKLSKAPSKKKDQFSILMTMPPKKKTDFKSKSNNLRECMGPKISKTDPPGKMDRAAAQRASSQNS